MIENGIFCARKHPKSGPCRVNLLSTSFYGFWSCPYNIQYTNTISSSNANSKRVYNINKNGQIQFLAQILFCTWYFDLILLCINNYISYILYLYNYININIYIYIFLLYSIYYYIWDHSHKLGSKLIPNPRSLLHVICLFSHCFRHSLASGIRCIRCIRCARLWHHLQELFGQAVRQLNWLLYG